MLVTADERHTAQKCSCIYSVTFLRLGKGRNKKLGNAFYLYFACICCWELNSGP